METEFIMKQIYSKLSHLFELEVTDDWNTITIRFLSFNVVISVVRK